MLKAVVFGVMEGKARKGRPRREWTDDITDWCTEDLNTLRCKATDQAEWQRVVRHAINTKGSPRPWSQITRKNGFTNMAQAKLRIGNHHKVIKCEKY